MICTKCKIDKQPTEYETYWHSTKKRHFTRKICRGCMNAYSAAYREMIKQKKIMATIASNEQIDPFKDQPGYKFCRECLKWKNTKTEWYSNKAGHTHTFCKFCTSIKERIKNAENRKIYLQENCGGNDVRLTPGVYVDEYQEGCVCTLMDAMGWKLNPINNIWWKEGFKDENGKWLKYNNNETKYPYTHPLYKNKDNYKNEEHRVCRNCNEIKPLNSVFFPKSSKHYLRNICKECVNANQKDRYSENKYIKNEL